MALRPRHKSAIAKRFKTFRQRSLMSQAKLGHVIEICRQAVNKIENGRVTPHHTTWDRFCNLEASTSRHEH
jgi:DNA-binding XRE family transcriptional regulator